MGFQGGAGGKEPACQCRRCRDVGSIFGLGRSPGGGNGKYSSVLAWRIPWTEEPSGLLSAAAAAAKSLQSCPTLFDPIDSSPPGSPVPGILQARTLEWVAISFSSA